MMGSPRSAERVPRHQCQGILARVAYRYAQRQGLDVLPLIEQAGLTLDALNDPNATVGVINQIRFVELIADALDDSLLGFNLVRNADLREIGLLYYVMASAEIFGDALLRLERYIHLANEGVKLKVDNGTSVRATFYYSGIARHIDQHQISAFIFLLIRASRHLTGRALSPTRVRVIHQIAAPTPKVEGLLGSTVEAGADVDQVEFPTETWNFRVISADPYLHRTCIKTFEDTLVQRKGVGSSLKTRVENEIAALLPHGQARHDLVADRLGMSSRTLARRLSEEDTSFVEILSGMRATLASRYIADRTIPISQIAWMLGYAEVGTFTRAYQRWTGQVPSMARGRS